MEKIRKVCGMLSIKNFLLLTVAGIVNAFGVVRLAMKFIGVALVYDGISDLWIVSRTAKAAKAMREEAEALDVEYKEADPDEDGKD